ncbi:uroporphyrinogen-III C-methyltransferase [Luteimonas vadosa]|uniref:uroporphyrinogen-III C-methyltransferase n=1 Tax=Luteimonas vadosa TaxID=1165507 RepID=UPI0031E9A2F0
MTPDSPSPASPPRRSSALFWLLALGAVVLATGLGWRQWQAVQAERVATAGEQQLLLQSLERRLDALRRDQRAQAARLRQATDTNRVLRDELLGIAQRAALLEDSLDRLSDPRNAGPQALRLDEVEWLLDQGRQRLELAGDLAGARRAYAMAARRLDGVAGPGFLDLRQTLEQERAALGAMDADPKALAAQRIDAFAAQLPPLTLQPEGDPQAAARPWWRRIADRIVAVRRSEASVASDPADRVAALAALQLELSLARASAERRDAAGYRAAIDRADAWLQRLWPAPVVQGQRQRLRALRELPLALDVPTLGSTIEQLQRLRDPD